MEDKQNIRREENVDIEDYLAVRRTRMANDRTLLSYVRTCLGLVTAGVAMIQFFHSGLSFYIGVTFLVLGPVLFIVGLVQHHITRKLIREKGYFDIE